MYFTSDIKTTKTHNIKIHIIEDIKHNIFYILKLYFHIVNYYF